MSDAADEKQPEEKKRSGLSLTAIALIANSVLLAAVVGFLAWQALKPGSAEATPADKGGEHGEKAAEKKSEDHGAPKEAGHGEKAAEGHGEAKGGEHGGSAEAMGPLVKVSDFVIHLRNPEVDRYARMTFDVEVFGESDKQALNDAMPKVRDLFISYLSDRTVEELSGSEGLNRTKEELQARLRRLTPGVRIRGMYISDFVVQ